LADPLLLFNFDTAAILLIASEPGLRTKGIALTFAASPPALTTLSQRILDDTAWTGTGAGTFAAIMSIYRNIDDPATSTAPTAAAALSIELGRAMFWLIVAVIRVSLARTKMQIDDKLVDLSPGMAVAVEIKTGSAVPSPGTLGYIAGASATITATSKFRELR
jgi:hypothetical protein